MAQLRIGHESLVASNRALFSDQYIRYINVIDLRLNDFIAKFADDTKIGNSVISDRDWQSLQEEFYKISAWCDRWEMPFNVNKCHILQSGNKKKKNLNTKWVE